MNQDFLTYTCKTAALSKPLRVRLNTNCIDVFNDLDGQWVHDRTIQFDNVKKIRFYRELHAIDKITGKFSLRHIGLILRSGKNLRLSSAYVTGNQGRFLATAKNQRKEFDAFVDQLMCCLSAADSSIQLQSGWLGAAIAWAIIALLGLGFVVLGGAMVFIEADLFSAIPAILFLLLFGVMMLWMGFVLAREYMPTSVSIGQTQKTG